MKQLQKSTPRRRRGSSVNRQGVAGWLFVLPVLLILGIFLFLPVLMAAWVSVSDWSGDGSPLSPDVHFIGLTNYQEFLSQGGLPQKDFGTAIRNNLYYVVVSVPLVTSLALALALIVNRRRRGVGAFRTAFYFPSVTSSVAMTVIFLFLFNAAIAEMVRYLSPLQKIERLEVSDEGPSEYVLLNFASANHDPTVWADPGRLDIHRPRHPNLAFGAGPHSCLGMAVATHEAQVFLDVLLRSWPGWELDGEPEIEWVPDGTTTPTLIDRFDSVPVRVPAAPDPSPLSGK